MKKTKVYISGAISGRERQDYLRQFGDAERKLLSLGYKVCNPTKLLPSRHLWVYRLVGYKLTLLYDFFHLLRCDKILMLDGWESSRGARCEKALANEFGIKELIIFT